jgi:hypothetical protein
MPPSKLPPPKGKCYHCAKPTAAGLRFCPGRSCQCIYYYRQQHPEVQRVQKPTEKHFRLTSNGRSKQEVDAAVERIYQRAKDAGTLGWSRLAPQEG